MSYTIDIVVPAVPDGDEAAWAFVENLRKRGDDGTRARAPSLATLHEQVSVSYPCLSSYEDEDPGLESCPWADAPLIGSEIGVLALSSGPYVESVVAFVTARASQLGLTVFDPQQGRIHRPPKPEGYALSIDGILNGFAQEDVIVALVRMVKREETQIRALLAAPGMVVKRGLDRATAEKYKEALKRIGCACRILPAAAAAAAPPEATPASSFDRCQEAAHRGDAQAQHELGMTYSKGKGVAQDGEQAAHWLEKSAGQGYLPAICVLADCYYTGRNVSKNYAMALHWANIAAERGDQSAQFLLWRMYKHGEGIQSDQVKANAWLVKAAKQGHAQAQFETGKNLYRATNLQFAAMWFTKAAAQGHPEAQSHLAAMYARGEGVQRDAGAAVQRKVKAEK